MTKFFGIVAFFLMFLYGVCSSHAQEYLPTVHHYSIEDGLSDRHTRFVFQDSKGFIWILTPSGMNRFDGQEFRQFTKEQHGLSSNNLGKVLEDRNGQLWFVSLDKLNRDGLAYFSSRIDVFAPISEKSKPLEKLYDLPFDIKDLVFSYQDHQRNIWYSSRQGKIFKFDGNSFQLMFQKKVGKNWAGHYMIATDGTIVIKEQDKVTVLDSLGNPLYQASLPYPCQLIYAANDNKIWLGSIKSRASDQGFLKQWYLTAEKSLQSFTFTNENGNPFKIPLDKTILTNLSRDNNGKI